MNNHLVPWKFTIAWVPPSHIGTLILIHSEKPSFIAKRTKSEKKLLSYTRTLEKKEDWRDFKILYSEGHKLQINPFIEVVRDYRDLHMHTIKKIIFKWKSTTKTKANTAKKLLSCHSKKTKIRNMQGEIILVGSYYTGY